MVTRRQRAIVSKSTEVLSRSILQELSAQCIALVVDFKILSAKVYSIIHCQSRAVNGCDIAEYSKNLGQGHITKA